MHLPRYQISPTFPQQKCVCGKTFRPRRSNQRHCSVKCRRRAYEATNGAERRQRYNTSDKRYQVQRRYNISEAGKRRHREWRKRRPTTRWWAGCAAHKAYLESKQRDGVSIPEELAYHYITTGEKSPILKALLKQRSGVLLHDEAVDHHVGKEKQRSGVLTHSTSADHHDGFRAIFKEYFPKQRSGSHSGDRRAHHHDGKKVGVS